MRTILLFTALALAACFSQTEKKTAKKPGFGLSSPQDSAGDMVTGGPTQPSHPGLSGPGR
jgi:hypothetical protein